MHNYILGAKLFDDGTNGRVAFGLFDGIDINAKVEDNFLFQLIPNDITFNVDIVSVDFDKDFNDIIQSSKQELNLLDTAIINNQSPASLIHQVHQSRDAIESFTTSFGTSQVFMDTMSSMARTSRSHEDSRYWLTMNNERDNKGHYFQIKRAIIYR